MSDGSHPKYLSRVGDMVRAYFPHTTMIELLADPKVIVAITEGEYKALSIAEELICKGDGLGDQKRTRVLK